MTGSSTETPGRTGLMDRARLDAVELEYQVIGSGEAVLLIPPGPLADGFLPFLSEETLADRYRLIQFHRRGQVGSSQTTPPVSYSDQAADAAGLLSHLGVGRAHVSATPPEQTSHCSYGVATEEPGDSARDGLRALDLQQVTDALHGQVFELGQPRAQQARAVDEQLLSLGAQHRQDRL
jgi:hypothetical protein